eukprot:COSAG06_NODE_4528_length_4175_cov_3.406281_3_plen_162_part_00
MSSPWGRPWGTRNGPGQETARCPARCVRGTQVLEDRFLRHALHDAGASGQDQPSSPGAAGAELNSARRAFGGYVVNSSTTSSCPEGATAVSISRKLTRDPASAVEPDTRPAARAEQTQARQHTAEWNRALVKSLRGCSGNRQVPWLYQPRNIRILKRAALF